MVTDYWVLCCLCLEAENHSGKWRKDSSQVVEIHRDWGAQRTETAALFCSVHGIDALLGLLLCLNNTKIYFISRALLQSLWVVFTSLFPHVPVNVKANSHLFYCVMVIVIVVELK